MAEVQKLPLVHDPSLKTPRAQLSTADQQAAALKRAWDRIKQGAPKK